MLLLAYTDVSGNFYYTNPKEGTMGFLVVPNSPPCVDGNPKECEMNESDYIDSFYEIHA